MINTEFLNSVLCSEGPYCLFLLKRDTEKRFQKFYDDVQSLVRGAGEYDDAGYDVYYAMASFKDASSREADNARALKCFYFDLDCRPGKEYSSQTEALEALQNFCMRTALPKPKLVNSGGGIHAYWVLDKEVTREVWQPVADRIKAYCRAQGFLMDMTVPADAARVLRIPGTHNYKDEPPSEVVALAKGSGHVEFEDFANKFGDAEEFSAPTTYIPPEYSAMSEQLLQNRTSSFRKILQSNNGCAQLVEITTNQNVVSEPLWRAGLSIAVHCEDADTAIHAISKKHDQYSFEDTEIKARRIKGPYLCTRFDELNEGICKSCPHWGKIKSPIVLGNTLKISETEEERTVEVPSTAISQSPTKVVVPAPPKPYVRGAGGGVYIRTINDDGDPEDKLVYHNDLYITRRVYDSLEGYFLVMRVHLPQDGVKEFMVSQQAASSPDELRKLIAAHGVTASSKQQWTAIGVYIMDYVNEMQHRAKADDAHRQFGWTKDFKSFVIGNREYRPGSVGFNPPTAPTASLFDAFEPKGTLDEWKEMMEFFNHDGMTLHQLIVCTGFGSPIMAFSPIHSMLLHLEGPTGFGKTTTQYAAAGIYGNPAELVVASKDTNNTVLNRFEIMKNIPMYIDEFSNVTARGASDMAYALAEGRQRNRMSSGSNVERFRGAPWYLCAVSSGNTSIMALLDAAKALPDAERERVFEVNVNKYVYAYPKHVADEFQQKVKNEVYGVAAEPYIQWLVDNVDTARELFIKTQRKLDQACGLTSKNRMISAGFAAYLTGGAIASDLGLIPYDMQRLFDLCVQLITARLAHYDGSQRKASDFIAQYLAENYNNILRINSTEDKTDIDTGSVEDTFVVPDGVPRGELLARWEPDVKMLYLMKHPFNKWCVDQHLNSKALLEELKKEYTVDMVSMRPAKGTRMNIPTTPMIRVNMPLEGHTDGGSET